MQSGTSNVLKSRPEVASRTCIKLPLELTINTLRGPSFAAFMVIIDDSVEHNKAAERMFACKKEIIKKSVFRKK